MAHGEGQPLRGGEGDEAGATDKRDFFRRLRETPLPPKHRAIGRYLAASYRMAASQTAAEVSAAVGTSEATVIRFALRLGYDGYPDLRRHLHRMVHEDLTSVELLQRPLPGKGRQRRRDALTSVVEAEMEHLRALAADLSREDLGRLVSGLHDAPRVYVAGHRASASLAEFLGYTLAKVHPDVVILTRGGSRELDAFRSVPAGAWLVALAFARYPRETLDAMDLAREERLGVGAITDSVLSPVAKRADVVLPVAVEPVSFVDSYAAPQALIAALLVEYGLRAPERTRSGLARFEGLVKRHAVFYATE
jgi:DNA-binding MurR/RpiR family transcriptional regulator